MTRSIIHTDAAPKAIGTYSQAVRCGATVYLAGQIGLDPATMEMVAGIGTVYLTDLGHFALVNETMARYFAPPYPARAAVGVASLPRGALVEMDAIMVLQD